MVETTLWRLQKGQTGTVTRTDLDERTVRRLTDLGLVRGTAVMRLYDAPSGDPSAYALRGTVLALRKSDASHIYIRLAKDGEP